MIHLDQCSFDIQARNTVWQNDFLFTSLLSTHVQYTRSVTGRKRGDASRRIVTACRLVATRHESLPTVSTVTPEVMSRKGIAEVNFRY